MTHPIMKQILERLGPDGRFDAEAMAELEVAFHHAATDELAAASVLETIALLDQNQAGGAKQLLDLVLWMIISAGATNPERAARSSAASFQRFEGRRNTAIAQPKEDAARGATFNPRARSLRV